MHLTVALSDDKECSPALFLFSRALFKCLFFSAVNFGAIGVFMAHEILHTFYDYGGYWLWCLFNSSRFPLAFCLRES